MNRLANDQWLLLPLLGLFSFLDHSLSLLTQGHFEKPALKNERIVSLLQPTLYSQFINYLAIFVFVCMLFRTPAIPSAGQTDNSSNQIQIVWSDSKGEIFSYVLRPTQSSQIEVHLVVAKKTFDTRSIEWPGGFEALLALTEQASQEITGKRLDAPKSKDVSNRRLTLTFVKARVKRSASIEGGSIELTQFFRNTAALKEILKFVSKGQPKAYRLFDEYEPSKQLMRPPKR